jgi:type I restriction enzyme S subunit
MTTETKFKKTEIGIIPEDWDVVRIDDVLSSIIDYRGKTPRKSSSGIRTLSAKSIKHGRIDYDQTYCISEETFREWERRGKPQVGDVLVTTEGPLGEIAQLDRQDVAIAQRLLTVRGKDKQLDNSFLKYFLMSPLGQHELLSKATGTTVEGIKQSEFRNILIAKPLFEEQMSIATVLSDLDAKIELNHTMNITLDALAKAIFRHWFIDFEFPSNESKPYRSSGGEMVKSELGEIPKLWRIGLLPEIVEIVYGYPFNSQLFNDEMGFPLIRIRDLPTDKSGTLTTEDFDKRYLIRRGDIVAGMDGEFRTYLWKGHDVLQNQRVCKFIGKTEQYSNAFIYFVVSKPLRTIEGEKVGSTVIHLSKTDIDSTKVIVPTQDVLEKYNEISVPLFEEMISKTQEALILEELRDLLLPKLMSGKVRVPIEAG